MHVFGVGTIVCAFRARYNNSSSYHLNPFIFSGVHDVCFVGLPLLQFYSDLFETFSVLFFSWHEDVRVV